MGFLSKFDLGFTHSFLVGGGLVGFSDNMNMDVAIILPSSYFCTALSFSIQRYIPFRGHPQCPPHF